MSDDVTITVRVNNQTAAGFRDINGQLRTMDGRFATAAGSMSRSSNKAKISFDDLKATLLSLAPAAVPVAAAMVPIAAHAGAAGLAVGAFGAALKPQITNLSDAAKAQDKYSQAVQQYGAHSKQAVQAQQQAAQVLKGMPQATQHAAAAYSNLRDQFKTFSDSTAKFTMQPVEHSFALLGQIIPKLTPMVESTSTQFDRLMKVAGGAINTSGFDALSKRVSDFANQSLKSATDKAISFARALSEGNAHGPIASFMEYARAQGPAVRDLITNLAEAVSNLLQGAAQAGPGLLSIVNAFAKLVAAVPPSLVGALMSVYAAFRLIKLAGAGVDVIASGYATLAARVTGLRAAAVAAGGGLAGMNAALNTLSTGGKAALALGVVGALALAMHKLSDNKAPVAVDALSTSLNTLASTGKVTGVLKTDFQEISESIAMVSKGASDNSIATMVSDFGTWVGIAKGPSISDAKKNIDAWDKSMANLARSGKTKEAAAQFEILKKAWVAGGGDLKRLNKFTDDYHNALADQKFEAKMTADSMGLFGAAAQDTAAKLDAQKASADGLRQSIQALNDVNRQGLGGMIGFEAAIDAASKAAKDNAGALSMNHGVLDLNSEKARNAASALQDLADKTDSAAASARESGSSWETVNGIYSRGRSELIKSARAMGLNKEQAAQLADQILKIPDKTAKIKMNDEDAKAGLTAFNAAVKRTPGSKSVTLKALSKSAEQALEALGYKVTHLKDGSVRVTAKTGGALSGIRNVAGAIASLHDKTVTLTSIHNVITNSKTYRSVHDITGKAAGGRVPRYADGGDVQIAPDGLIRGPGTGTSDDIYALFASGAQGMVSDTEFVVNAASTKKYLPLLEMINKDKLGHYAKGGKLTKAQQRARAQSQAEQQARSEAMGNLTISHFGRYAGYQRSEFGSALGRPDSVGSLVNALNEWRGIIKKATHGGTESRLLKQLDSTGKKLLGYEKAHEKLIKSLEKAKDKLNSLKDASAQLASSVKGNLISSANITRGTSGEGTVTLSSVRSGLIASRDKVTAFASALKQLKSKGFSRSIIQQVAEAGIDGGGLETAGALLQASASEVSTINQMQGQIEKAAGSAGKTTADAVYAKAIKDQTKVVDKLTKQQDKLSKSMDKLTKAMEKAIEKAFKHKAAGGIVGAAASGGLRNGLTMVGEQGFELLDLPAGSRVWSNPDSRRKLAAAQAPWSSMLNAPRRPGSAAGAASAPVQPIIVHQTITLDGRVVARQIFDPLREEIRNKGGNVQKTLGQPGR
ncbi:phage tail protein [Streptomyces sp. NPDC001177]